MHILINKNRIGHNKRDIAAALIIIASVFNSFMLSIINAVFKDDRYIFAVSIIVYLLLLVALRKSIYLWAILIFTFLNIITLANYTIFHVNGSDYAIIRFLVCVLPLFFAGAGIDFVKYNRFIYTISVCYIFILFIYVTRSYVSTLTVMNKNIDILGFAYYAIPSIPVIIYNFTKRKNLVSIVSAVTGAAYLIICGTRGPILCVLVYIVFSLFINRDRFSTKKLLVFALIIITLGILAINAKSIARYLYPIFVEKNYSTRLLLYFLNDSSDVFSLTGREDVYEAVKSNIDSHFIFGTGLYSDRLLLGGYSHSLVYEIINSFGVVLGSFLLIALVLIFAIAFKLGNNDERQYLAIFFSGSIVKLLMSSTFLNEPLLFILIGYSIRIIETSSKHRFSQTTNRNLFAKSKL